MKFNSNKERVNNLKNRIIINKPLLPRNYTTLILEILPKYDSASGSTLIHNVMTLKSTNEEITIAVEQIAKLNSKSNDQN